MKRHEVIMPALGMTQDSGDILSWHKSVGEAVAADDVLMDVETDKTTMEMEAGFDGYVAEIRALAGQTVAVGEVIAILTSEAPEGVRALATELSECTVKEPVATHSEVPATRKPTWHTETPDSIPASASTLLARPVVSKGDRLLASPKARLLAHQRGVKLERLVQLGIEEPLQSIDVERFIDGPRAVSSPTSLLQARVIRSTFDAFAGWASEESQGSITMAHVWSFFSASAFRQAQQQSGAPSALVVCAESWMNRKSDLLSVDADRGGLYDIAMAETCVTPDLRLRILVGTALVNYQPAIPDLEPVLTVTDSGDSLLLSFGFNEECVHCEVAQSFLTILGDRLLQPLRHLL